MQKKIDTKGLKEASIRMRVDSDFKDALFELAESKGISMSLLVIETLKKLLAGEEIQPGDGGKIDPDLAERLARVRSAIRMTPEELSGIGHTFGYAVTPAAIKRIEAGKEKASLGYIRLLIDRLDANPNFIMLDEAPPLRSQLDRTSDKDIKQLKDHALELSTENMRLKKTLASFEESSDFKFSGNLHHTTGVAEKGPGKNK